MIRGDNIKQILASHKIKKDTVKVFNMDTNQDQIVKEIISLNGYYVLGIGNIVDWGEKFVEKIQEFA